MGSVCPTSKKQEPPPPPPLLEEAWRKLDWEKKKDMRDQIRSLKVSNSEVKDLRILVHGPVGTGKSSFINSIDSIFQERMTSAAIADAPTDRSFTKRLNCHKIKDASYESYLPFVICDVMGLEKGDSDGVLTEDLKNILDGHIRVGYMFNSTNPCPKDDPHYNSNPQLSDKIHCLVSVIAADNPLWSADNGSKDGHPSKMRDIRAQASKIGIPQVVIMTKIDKACREVSKDIKNIYKSKKFQDKMERCSNHVGVPLNCFFPVKNYHQEIDLNDDMDVLLLSALTHILNFANDYVAEQKKESVKS